MAVKGKWLLESKCVPVALQPRVGGGKLHLFLTAYTFLSSKNSRVAIPCWMSEFLKTFPYKQRLNPGPLGPLGPSGPAASPLMAQSSLERHSKCWIVYAVDKTE